MHTKISNVTIKIIIKECKNSMLTERKSGMVNKQIKSIQKKGRKIGTWNKQD